MADLDAGLAALRDAAARNTPMVRLSPAEARERVVAGNRLCSAGPQVTVVDLHPPDGGPSVPVRVYEGDTVSRTMVYAHGGGWVTGDLDYSDELCRFLARDGDIRVVSVDYRLAPAHPFPAGLEDLAAAWTWTARVYEGPLALGGDSSGGNLAAAVAHRLARTSNPAPTPTFLLLLYPVLGLPDSTPSYRARADAFPIGAADMRWFFRHYLAGDRPSEPSPDLVPLHATDLSGMPRTHLVLSGHDPVHDEGAAFAAALAAAGVKVSVADHPDLCHGFLRFTDASAGARDARSKVVEAVQRLAAPRSTFIAAERIPAYDSGVSTAEHRHAEPGEN